MDSTVTVGVKGRPQVVRPTQLFVYLSLRFLHAATRAMQRARLWLQLM